MPDAPDLGTLSVSFAIVGAQKAATSTLHSMLVRHRNVARGEAKELHFFDDERLDWDAPDYARLRVRKTQPLQLVAGDATPSYLFWPRALERMQRYDPAMKLIASFRDPIERAFSQWSMERQRQDWWPSFGEAVTSLGDLSVLHEIPAGLRSRDVRRRSMVVRGLYGAQLERGLSIFPRSQWLLLSFPDLVSSPATALDRVAVHLGIGPWHTYPPLRSNPTPRSQTGPAPTASDLLRLVSVYESDLAHFSDLSGIDVSSWTTARIAAGTLDPAQVAADLARKVGLDPAD